DKKHKDSNISDETPQLSKSDIDLDVIMNEPAALSINCVEREEKLNRNDIENMIQHTVTKTIKDLNRKQTQQKANKLYTYYLYGQENHIVKNCPNQNKGESQTNKAITFNNTNIRLVEFTEKGSTISGKYLKVELLDDDECGDIKAFGKRKGRMRLLNQSNR
ncbi:34719_t:CDS:1, partial [Racocetra persica]